MNVWTNPNKAFSPLGRCSGILLLLLDCPARSKSAPGAMFVRNWRLLKAFAEASGVSIVSVDDPERIGRLVEELSVNEHLRRRHIVIAGRLRAGSMLPIVLEAAMRGLQVSIVCDAFVEGRFASSAAAPLVARRPFGEAPLYVATNQVLAQMLVDPDVDEPSQ